MVDQRDCANMNTMSDLPMMNIKWSREVWNISIPIAANANKNVSLKDK